MTGEGTGTDKAESIDDITLMSIGLMTPPQPGEISDVTYAVRVGYALAKLRFSALQVCSPVEDYGHRALELIAAQEHPDPDQAFLANQFMGWYLGSIGKPQEALRYAEECQRLQPDNYKGTRLTAKAHNALGDKRTAVRLYLKSLGQQVLHEYFMPPSPIG